MVMSIFASAVFVLFHCNNIIIVFIQSICQHFFILNWSYMLSSSKVILGRGTILVCVVSIYICICSMVLQRCALSVSPVYSCQSNSFFAHVFLPKAFCSINRNLMQNTFCVQKKFILASGLLECQKVIGHTGKLFCHKRSHFFVCCLFLSIFLPFLFPEISKPISLHTFLHLFLK